MSHDQKWEEKGYFDGLFNYDRLRTTQLIAGPDMVRTYGDLFIAEKRKQLLEGLSLFALTCGAGKTLLMVSVLFAACQEVSQRMKYAPRCRNALWFVKERALGVQLKLELEGEITKYHLADIEPSVQICDQTGDLDRGPGHHDITISCPHVLWQGAGQRRSDEEIARLLAQFDTFIWDECDFAYDQIERLLRLGPHGLKFGLTASPIESSGAFLRGCFILAGVASYNDVYINDRCLKPMVPWASAIERGFVRSIKHDGYARFERGVETSGSGTHGERYSLPGSMAAIRAAIQDSADLETTMKQRWPEQWFSPHILVVCNTIEEAIDLAQQTEREIEKAGLPFEEGWCPTVMVTPESKAQQRSFKPRSKAEQRLFHKNSGLVHPFLLAKQQQYGGRCTRECSRILFVVDMAIRGMNNWPLLYVVDVKRSGSVSEQVQTVGRLARLPKHLAPMVGNAELKQLFELFCHPRWYFPNAGQDAANAIQEAWNFVLEMDERIEAAHLLQWSDLLDGKSPKTAGEPQELMAPFTLGERIQIDHILGTMKTSNTPITEESIEQIIESLPSQTEERSQHIRAHIKRVLSDPSYRASFIDLNPPQIIRPVSREEPKADYTDEELISFVLHTKELDNSYVDRIHGHRADAEIRQLIASWKRQHDVRLYRPVSKLRQLHDENDKPGIIDGIRNSLFGELLGRGLIDRASIANVSKAVNIATGKLAGINDTRNDGPLDRPAYHYQLIVPSTKRRIKEIAVAHLINWNVIGNVAALYADVMGVADAAE